MDKCPINQSKIGNHKFKHPFEKSLIHKLIKKSPHCQLAKGKCRGFFRIGD